MLQSRNRTILWAISVLLAVCLADLPVYARYGGGAGTVTDPYRITTAADLIALGETVGDYGKHFKLVADIDLDPNLPGRKVFDRAVIAPNHMSKGFTGTFNGDGHTILHLTIVGGSYLGLFGRLDPPASISNLGLEAVEVRGTGDYIGGLVGVNYDGIIATSYSTGAVSGSRRVGGLVGVNYDGSFTMSYSTGSVGGTLAVGGLVGANYDGSIATSYSTGSVSGTSFVGGLVGDNGGNIATSYSNGAVSGESYVGGLVGGNYDDGSIATSYSNGSVSGTSTVGGLVGRNAGNITTSYSNGAVSGESDAGGLVGANYDGSITSSFWDIQTSGRTTSAGGTGKTVAEMQSIATFLNAGWDFVGETVNGSHDIWKIAEGLGYPCLWWEKYCGGKGMPDDPYRIATAADLIALGETPDDYDKHFVLAADVDLAEVKVFDKAVIAADTDPNDKYSEFQGTPFTGVFDGNGHTISHLTIRSAGYSGLFGQLGSSISPGEVKNLAVTDVNITGSGDYVGGLVGGNSGTIICCYSTGTVNGGWYVGGLVGYNAGKVACCYSTAAVSGSDWIGGLAGYNSGSVAQCYSAGKVSHRSSYFGGLVGDNSGTVINCFWDTEASDEPTSAGGIGRTTAEMQTARTFLDAGWDFVGETKNGTDNIWWINEGKDYPRLWWELNEKK